MSQVQNLHNSIVVRNQGSDKRSKASQSSTRVGASYALDKDRRIRSETDANTDEWWKVDLQNDIVFYYAKIVPYYDLSGTQCVAWTDADKIESVYIDCCKPLELQVTYNSCSSDQFICFA